MARKRSGTGTRVPVVRHVQIDGRRFMTIGPEDPMWKSDLNIVAIGADFVRLIPPPDVSDERVAEVRAWCKKTGALDVYVPPRSRAKVVVEQAKVKYETKGIRETVEQMVTEANTQDREALKRVVEETLSAVKL